MKSTRYIQVPQTRNPQIPSVRHFLFMDSGDHIRLRVIKGTPLKVAGWFIDGLFLGYFMAKKNMLKVDENWKYCRFCRYPYGILWLDVKLWLKILWDTMGLPQYLDAKNFMENPMENPNFESGHLNWGYHFSYHRLRKPTDQLQLPSLEIPMTKVTANKPPQRPRNSVWRRLSSNRVCFRSVDGRWSAVGLTISHTDP